MPYLNKELTKQVRQELRSRYPEFKFSVRTRDHMEMNVTILNGPLDLLSDTDDDYESVNQYYVDEHYEEFPEKKDFLNEVLSVMTREHDSCVYNDMDYGNIPNFYISLSIGKWDKPYEVKN